MSSSSAIFSGSSRYSNDFQEVIDRAVKIASLPLTQLQNQKLTLTERSDALSVLATDFTALSDAIQSLDTSGGASSFSATVSDESAATISLSEGVAASEYSIEVFDTGSYSSSMSADTLPVVADPSRENISGSTSFTLTVAGQTYQLSPASGSLTSLAAAINGANAGVKAVLLNVGGSSQPDYRLTLRSEKLANVSVQLNDGSIDLMNTLTTGSPLTYRVNGQPATAISSDTRTVTVSPGVQVTLKAVGTTGISIARSASSAKDGIEAFVKAYNTAVDDIDKNRGTGAGPLAGDSLLTYLTNALRSLSGHQEDGGALKSLEGLGITLDKHGKLSFNQAKFDSNATADPDSVFSFLGSTTSGGFLKAAYAILQETSESSESSLQLAKTSLASSISNQDNLILENQERVDALRERLMGQMAAADALIANLEQQVKMIQNLFQLNNSND